MPEGIIIDPHQNQEERDHGLVTDLNMIYDYVKEEQAYSRLYMAGEVVCFQVLEEYDPARNENGITVHGRAEILGYSYREAERAPVIQQLTRPHQPNARAVAINNAINAGMPSPFGRMNLPAPNPHICTPEECN